MISTAHVPQVPNPRQLITRALPLCGVSPERNSAVRSLVPGWMSVMLLPLYTTVIEASSDFETGFARVETPQLPPPNLDGRHAALRRVPLMSARGMLLCLISVAGEEEVGLHQTPGCWGNYSHI